MSSAGTSADLESIPGVGPRTAADLMTLGILSVADLKGRDPENLYHSLEARTGGHVDLCVLYVFRCAVYYASVERHDPEKLKWWRWKDASRSRSDDGKLRK